MTSTSAAFPPEKTEEQKALEAAEKKAAQVAERDLELREEILDGVRYLLEDAFETALYRFREGNPDIQDVIDHIRVEVGLLHPQGPHHSAPGLEAALEGEGR